MEHYLNAVVPVRPLSNLNQRVGDQERSTTCDELAGHFAAGRLSGDELDQRLQVAMSAQTTRELRLLLADLPAEPSPAAPPTPIGQRSGWSAFDGLVLVTLVGSVMVVGVMMLGLAASGEVVMFLLATVGGSLAALAGACLVQLVRRAQQSPSQSGQSR